MSYTTTAMITLSLICKKCSFRAEYVGTPMRVPSANEARKEGWNRYTVNKDGNYADIWLCPTCHGEYDRAHVAPHAARTVAFAHHDAKWKETLMKAREERMAIFNDPALNGPDLLEWCGGGQ